MKEKDYHKYVFDSGKLIGDFENMYKNSEETPWHQDNIKAFPDIEISKTILGIVAPFNSLLDVGCGLGYYLNDISQFVENKDNVYGIDISKTAIENARKLFPDFNYSVCNLIEPMKGIQSVDVVVIRGFFWYVFNHMKNIVQNVNKLVNKDGYLLIHQNFPPLDSDFIGKEILPNPEALIKFFSKDFEIIYKNNFNILKQNKNDAWLSVLFKKRRRFK